MRTPASIPGLMLALSLALSHASTGCVVVHTHNVPPAIAFSPAIRDAVDAPERTADDRALDRGRHPGAVLSFFHVAPGQRVAELFAGGGYTTELLARIVGPTGHVWAQNNTTILDRFARAPLAARLARPGLGNVTAVEREFNDPLPEAATNLDAVLFILAYHDTVWMHVDREAMNRAVFRALRPGGVYGIVDHRAADAHGTDDVETLHRIQQRVIVSEVEHAGFRLDATSPVLANPEDHYDWNDSPRAAGERRGTSDRFVLRFVKP